MRKIALINGVNLDRLGKREPQIYGSTTLSDIVAGLRKSAASLGAEIVDFQSNHEGEIVDKIYELADSGVKYAIINPGAFTHTSVALRDCIVGSGMTFVEVHISNVAKREEFRHLSVTAPACIAQIRGHGFESYTMAIDMLAKLNPEEK